MLYSIKTLRYYHRNKCVVSFPGSVNNIDIGKINASSCGDALRLHIKVEDEAIIDSKHNTYGYGSTDASSGLVVELVQGLSTEQPMDIKNVEIVNVLRVLLFKTHCSTAYYYTVNTSSILFKK